MEVRIYAKGLVACSVCVPATCSISEMVDEVNSQNPTGIDSKWRISEDNFKTGEKNPHQCEEDETRLHFLLTC